MTQQTSVLEQVKKPMFGQIKAIAPNEQQAKSLYATAIRLANNPAILACTPQSITETFVRIIDLGLQLDPVFGEVNLLPYKNYKTQQTELTVQLGAKGLAALAGAMGGWQIQVIPVFNCDVYESEEVFKNGFFETELTFKKNKEVREANIHDQDWCIANLRLVLANARRLENGKWETVSLELSRNEVERRRLMSQAQKATNYTKEPEKKRLAEGLPIGIWATHYLEMVEKTAIAAIARKLPKTKSMEKLINVVEDKPIEIEQPKPQQLQQQQDENIEDADFSDVPKNEPPANVDMETGEVLDAQLTDSEQAPEPVAEQVETATATAQVVYTQERYVAGVIKSCTTNNELVAFWQTVPDDIKPKFQDKFEEKQDLMR